MKLRLRPAVFKSIVSSALLFTFCSPLAFAQSSAGGGSIQGTVKDSSGAVIPDAKLKILHIDTGRAINTVSNKEGYFATPPTSIGKYKIRVESAGMKAWEGEIQLETGRTTEVNPVLSAGQVNETVVVSETLPLVTTTDPTDASTLDAARIKELPINGRDLNTLLGDVAPGIEPVIDVNGGIRTSGMMVYSTNYVQDGAASNNREFGGSMNIQGLESVGEVRVETSTSSAKYSAPASVILTTKGGTNKVRMALYETARNNAFGVARARQDVSFTSTPYQTPKLIRNEFGGSIGGPVYIPKVYDGRNRTFFFVSREAVELRQGLTRDFTVPTAAQRTGDFSDLIDSSARKLTLYDPLTGSKQTLANGRVYESRLPFNNNVIPSNRESPLAKRIWAITPLPSDTGANPLASTNLKSAVATNGSPNLSDNPTTVRVDHRFSEKDNFFIKTNGGRRIANFIGTAGGIGAPTTNGEANVTYLAMQAISGAMSWTHVFTPRFFVESLANHTWQSSRTITGPSTAQQDWSKELGLPNPYAEIGFPNITSLGNFMTYTEGDNRRALTTRVLGLEQNYKFIMGTHDIEFGWRYHSEHQHLLPDQGAISGYAGFNSMATALENPNTGTATTAVSVAQTGYDGANFFLGYAGNYNVGLKRGYLRVIDQNSGLYLQDNWKVTSRLTITPGIRWDLNPALREENGQLNTFDIASHSVLLPNPLDFYYKLGVTNPKVVGLYQNVGMKFASAAELNKPPEIFKSNLFDFGPRIGFAYKLFDGKKQVIMRGGYGIYFSPIPMRSLLVQFSVMAPFRATFSYNPNSASQSPDGAQNYLLRNAPTLIAGQNTANAVDINSPNALGIGQGVNAIDPNFPDMKIHEWNFTIEKLLNASTALRIRYNGKHGIHADQINNINPQLTDYAWYLTQGVPIPGGATSSVARRLYDKTAYTAVNLIAKTGFINTETFTLEMERRFSKGLGFQGFYTMTNSWRAAGNTFRDGGGSLPAAFLPGAVPTDPGELNRFLNYSRDTGIPKHRFRWNWTYDLPFGRGRKFAGHSNRIADAMIGGWKFSGTGTVVSSWFALPTGNWGTQNPLEVYGTKYRILDCRQTSATATSAKDERCFEGYLFYNGYISQRQINTKNAAGLRNGIYGLPSGYKPVQSPVNAWPVGGLPADPGSNLYDTNTVTLRLANSNSNVQVTPDPGLHPFRNQSMLGPFNWTMDTSMLKYFNLTESGRVRLRANFDVFNVLNVQGLNPPGGDGVSLLSSSYGGFGFKPRQVQVTMRLEW